MKEWSVVLAIILVLFIALAMNESCDDENEPRPDDPETEPIDDEEDSD